MCQLLPIVLVITSFSAFWPSLANGFSSQLSYPNWESLYASAGQEWDVDLYQKHSFVWEYGSSIIDLLDPQPDETILDVGCGSGELTKKISDRGAIAVGIDADQSMIQRATENFPNCEFYQEDVTNLNLDQYQFLGGQVDAIFSNAALHWVKDAEDAVICMSNVLKPGGRFVVEFGGRGNVNAIVDASLKVQQKNPETDSPWYFPSIAEYSSILERHGIEVVSAALIDRPTLLDEGENGMKNWLKMFGDGLFKDTPEDEKEKFIDQAVDILKMKPNMYKDGQWYADYRRIRIVGEKS